MIIADESLKVTSMDVSNSVYIVHQRGTQRVHFKMAANELVRLDIIVVCDCLIKECRKIIERKSIFDTDSWNTSATQE
jgi:hypothetical protein